MLSMGYLLLTAGMLASFGKDKLTLALIASVNLLIFPCAVLVILRLFT